MQFNQKLLGEEGRQTECKFNILSKEKPHQPTKKKSQTFPETTKCNW